MTPTDYATRIHRAFAREVLRQMRQEFALAVLHQTHFLPEDGLSESDIWRWIARWLDRHGFLEEA